MSDSQILDELIDRGYHLNYLRGESATWEASISRPLPEQTTDGYIYAVGHGQHSLPSIALSIALDACENDFERFTPVLTSNFEADLSQPAFNLASALANLRKPTAPVFMRKL